MGAATAVRCLPRPFHLAAADFLTDRVAFTTGTSGASEDFARGVLALGVVAVAMATASPAGFLGLSGGADR